jgi:hypothetical protein
MIPLAARWLRLLFGRSRGRAPEREDGDVVICPTCRDAFEEPVAQVLERKCRVGEVSGQAVDALVDAGAAVLDQSVG